MTRAIIITGSVLALLCLIPAVIPKVPWGRISAGGDHIDVDLWKICLVDSGDTTCVDWDDKEEVSHRYRSLRIPALVGTLAGIVLATLTIVGGAIKNSAMTISCAFLGMASATMAAGCGGYVVHHNLDMDLYAGFGLAVTASVLLLLTGVFAVLMTRGPYKKISG